MALFSYAPGFRRAFRTGLRKATWLEIKTSKPNQLQQKLVHFGVEQIDFPDPSRFYFRAPGGQVFRVAPLDGGL